MKILLINPPLQLFAGPRRPALGIAYIAQELKRHNYGVEMLDIDAYRYSNREVIELVEKSTSDIIGIGGYATAYPYLHWLIPEIKKLKPKKKIILGGLIATSLKERCFERFPIDYEVIGEGEVTIIELLEELSAHSNLYRVKGIGFRRNGKIVFTDSRPPISSLDNVPILDDMLFPMKKILKNADGAFSVHVQRGCPYNCTFCLNSSPVVSKQVRYRPIQNVIEEMNLFKNKYKSEIKLFLLEGDCITLDKEWVINFCKELINRKINIKYRVASRVDTIDEERLEWLARSGCARMSLGLESGSDKMLKIMKKNTIAERGAKAVSLAKKYIPLLEVSIMFGYMGEDKNTLKETVKFCKELDVRPLLVYATPFPGTELYRIAVEKNLINDEEQYLMGLGQQSINKFSLNLTDMHDLEAKYEINYAAKEIEKFYLWKDIKNFNIYKRAILKWRKEGIRKTAIAILKGLKDYVI